MGGYIGARAGSLSTTTVANVQDVTATDTTPEVTIINNTHEDTDGGREGKVIFKGQQSGGEESTLAEIQASHDGTADDEKGDLIFKTNDGNDATSPTERLRLDSAGDMLLSSPDPSLTITNTTHEDTDGGRESTIVFKGEQSGGELTTLAEIEVSHQGTADDEKGNIKFKVNDGNDGASPTLSTEITSDGGVHIKPELQSPLIVENPATNSQGAYIKIRDGNSTASQHTWLGRSTHDTYLYANNSDLGIKVTGGSSNAGLVTLPNQIGFSYLGSKSYVIGTTGTTAMSSSNVWASNVNHTHNRGSHFSPSTGRFTCPIAGRYQFHFRCQASNHTSGYLWFYMRLNQSVFSYAQKTQEAAHITMYLGGILELNANDYVDVAWTNNYVSGQIHYPEFTGQLIG